MCKSCCCLAVFYSLNAKHIAAASSPAAAAWPACESSSLCACARALTMTARQQRQGLHHATDERYNGAAALALCSATAAAWSTRPASDVKEAPPSTGAGAGAADSEAEEASSEVMPAAEEASTEVMPADAAAAAARPSCESSWLTPSVSAVAHATAAAAAAAATSPSPRSLADASAASALAAAADTEVVP